MGYLILFAPHAFAPCWGLRWGWRLETGSNPRPLAWKGGEAGASAEGRRFDPRK